LAVISTQTSLGSFDFSDFASRVASLLPSEAASRVASLLPSEAEQSASASELTL
jgi:hypothetical protein